MSKQKIAACIQALMFLYNTGAITAAEIDQKGQAASENIVVLHPTYHSIESTQSLIPNPTTFHDDEDKKNASSQMVEVEAALHVKGVQNEAWFSDVRQLSGDASKISTEIIDLHEKEIKAYEALYKKILAITLPYFPQGIPPQRFTSLRVVTDPSSYHILINSFDGFLHFTNQLPRLTTHPIHRIEKYGIYMPIFNVSQAGNLNMDAPPSMEDACGQIIEKLGHFTSFAHARREDLKRILRRIKNGVLLSSFVGTTAYFIWLQKTHQSQGSISDNYWINLAAHIGAWPLLEYPISIVYQSKNRSDTPKIDRAIIEHIPYIADVDPLVNCLARRYASKNLKQGIDRLDSQRNLYCWLFCCPVISRIQQLLKLPLRNVSEIERINTLLEGSYGKLKAKLYKDEVDNVEAEAAQRVCKKYDDILATVYTLHHNNLDDIVSKTKPELTLSYRRRNTLLGIMTHSHEQLVNCMPVHIRNKAQAQQ